MTSPVLKRTGYYERGGKTFKRRKGVKMAFWEDTAPKEIKIKVFTKHVMLPINQVIFYRGVIFAFEKNYATLYSL